MKTKIAYILIFFTLSSCVKNMIDNVMLPERWSPEMAFPIGKVELSLNNYFYNYKDKVLSDSLPVYFNQKRYLVDSNDLSVFENLPFDLHAFTSNPNKISKVMFRINIDNGYPSESMVQLYLLDPNLVIIDSLFTSNESYFPPGKIIDTNNIEQTHIQRSVFFDSTRLNKIVDVAHIRIKNALTFWNKNADTLMLFPSYNIKVQVGILLGFELKPDSAINTLTNHY